METNNWTTTNTGKVANSTSMSGGQVYWQVAANIRPNSTFTASFSYSLDGIYYATLEPDFTMINNWEFFVGYRYGIFNYATVGTGGSVTVESFTMEAT
jgi:hypothetical protein